MLPEAGLQGLPRLAVQQHVQQQVLSGGAPPSRDSPSYGGVSRWKWGRQWSGQLGRILEFSAGPHRPL